MDNIDAEKTSATHADVAIDRMKPSGLKLDSKGLPLDPQPSDHPDDPLSWPSWGKVYIVLMVSMLGLMAQLGSALINPAYVLMSKDLHITVEQASYATTVYILFAGISPMFVVPFSNVYGRRILYIVFTAIAVASQFGSGAARSYGGVMVGRVFYGIGGGIPLGIGAATICDLFPQGQRGFYLGIYTLFVNNGPHLAPIFGGQIALHLHWKWCFYVPGIIQGGMLFILLFTFPETLFSRRDFSKLEGSSYWSKLVPQGKILDRKITIKDFITPYRMIMYWAVSLPSVFWMTSNTYGSILFAVTGSRIAKELYEFNVGQTGLLMGVPLTVGCLIGEASAGWISDLIINEYAKRHGGYRKPEIRLSLLPGCLVMIVGIITYGPLVQDRKPWITLAVAMGLAGFGLQAAATMVYTYATDCYRPQSPEIGAVINLYKSIFAFTIGFYAIPFGEHSGWNVSFPVLGSICGVTLCPLVYLFFYGEGIRNRQGLPMLHEDL